MKEIPATLGYKALVDCEDFERLSAYRWYAHNCGGKDKRNVKRPARRTSVAEGRKVIFLVHELIRPPEGLVVDHINGDPWDNRRANLRVCTNAENVRNRRKHRNTNQIGNPYKGVYRRHHRFQALICLDGVIFGLGLHPTAEGAALAYDAAALFLHGEFARLNFPDAGTLPAHPTVIKQRLKAERSASRKAIFERAGRPRPFPTPTPSQPDEAKAA